MKFVRLQFYYIQSLIIDVVSNAYKEFSVFVYEPFYNTSCKLKSNYNLPFFMSYIEPSNWLATFYLMFLMYDRLQVEY